MEKFFNTAGPIKTDIHYYVDSRDRWDFTSVLALIRQEKYFILHAPRQTGKTSALLSLMRYLNDTGEYEAIYANIESAQAAREKVNAAMRSIAVSLAKWHEIHTRNGLLKNNWSTIFEQSGGYNTIGELLRFWVENTDKPVVLMLDEVDALVGDTLISLLRQLREGYTARPVSFPISIILCGVRDVRDYRIHSSSTKEIITGGSAFNIKAESLRLYNFTPEQLKNLYDQHTAATGQEFAEGVLELAWYYTEGQPWLVNALAYEATFGMKENQDRSRVITVEIFREAKERLILRRDTHLDQLTDKLQEPRVHRIIAPILAGKNITLNHRPDDIQYVRDLGLISLNRNGEVKIANAIYQEIIPRELIWTIQTGLSEKPAWYIRADGTLNMDKLISAFQQFFRKHSEHWIQQFQYNEAGPQLLLQAFLQRIVNGGGRIAREYGLGRGRTDLFIEYFSPAGKQEIVIEMKLLHTKLEPTIEKGIQQTKRYMDKCGAEEGHLIIFDRRTDRNWDDKIWQEVRAGIKIWGC